MSTLIFFTYITLLLSYDYGSNVMDPDDFIRSCNDVAICKALQGTFLLPLSITESMFIDYDSFWSTFCFGILKIIFLMSHSDRTTSKNQKRQACMLYLANYKAWTRKAVGLSSHLHTKVISQPTISES